MDQPTAGLIKDLKSRGLLKDTLVVWCTEFGRMPFLQGNGTGAIITQMHLHAFLPEQVLKKDIPMGKVIIGFKSVSGKSTVYDFNATILHLMGLDHERLSFYHNGLERRLTNVHGHVINQVLA